MPRRFPDLSVLIVDDDPATARLLASIIEEIGVRPVLAQRHAEAMAAARACPPAVVLLDLRLTGRDGLDLLRELRADAALAAVPAIGVTAGRTTDERVAAFAAACDDFVSKPFELDELLDLVEGYVVAAALGSRPLPLTDPVVSPALDHINRAAVAIDEMQRVLCWNRAAERQYGVPAAEALGAPLEEVYRFMWPEPDAEAHALAALDARGSWRGENVHLRRDGSRLRVESSVVRLRGEPKGMLALIRPLGEG